ncbi:co-chaperone HscB [Pseudomonas sp. F1_0610]|uniref:co-chaperone HscB n=1 Tax=Pseudomonas sp. F1_0610 TaxID=3114284 RepID=UPI0039C23980
MGDSNNYFALFSVEPSFEVDLKKLGELYRELAREVHPDRFVQASDTERRQALERSATLNDAYNTLKDTTSRALYLLRLLGEEIPQEATVQDPEFLFQQMQWREELEELQALADLEAVDRFVKRIKQDRNQLDQEFSATWQDNNHAHAELLARRMQFFDKLTYEARQLQERLDD